MRLRHAADLRTLLWVAMTIGLVAFQFARPQMAPYLFWLSAYFALSCGVIAHNHNHSPTFHGKRANEIFGYVISIFYGYPTFAWIPTHNLNHHKFVNRAGDATITWRHSKKNSFLVVLTYPFVSSYYQSEPTAEFIRNAKLKNRKLYGRIQRQYMIWGGAHVALLTLAIALHGWRQGLVLWSLVCLVPAIFALWTIMVFNYVQHIHTDPWSEHNHSRSFTGRVVNFFLFNNGLHAAHHEQAGAHWTKLPELHAKIADKIDPRLLHRSMWWYFIKQYLLATFVPSLGTTQVGRAAYDPPDGKKQLDLTSATVGLGDEGDNALIQRA
jgi:beta-carotene hydroxylase